MENAVLCFVFCIHRHTPDGEGSVVLVRILYQPFRGVFAQDVSERKRGNYSSELMECVNQCRL